MKPPAILAPSLATPLAIFFVSLVAFLVRRVPKPPLLLDMTSPPVFLAARLSDPLAVLSHCGPPVSTIRGAF